MKYNRGFNLISLLVSLVLGGMIAMGVSVMYADLVHSKLYGSNKQLLTLSYGTAINQLSMDIAQSGTFGCYNSRILGNSGYGIINTFSTSSVLRYESSVAGLYAFSSTNIPIVDSSIFSGLSLASNSDILKLQYGSGQAIITAESNIAPSGPLTFINFVQQQYTHVSGSSISTDSPTTYRLPISLSSATNAPYVIASCNRLDQIQGNMNTSTNTVSLTAYMIPSTGNEAHDMSSWHLMNFITRYYYVATISGITGLYVQSTQVDGSVGPSTLLAQGVTQINYNFGVESTTSDRQIKPMANMLATDWTNINQVIFIMSIKTAESVSMNKAPSIQSIQQSVMVRQ